MIRDEFGGAWPKGGTLTPKKSGFLGHKTPNFRRRRRRKFGKIKGFKEKLAVFWSFMGKFDRILINIVILDQFGNKNSSFFRF